MATYGTISSTVSEQQQTEILRGAIQDLPVGQQEGAFAAIAAFKNADDILALLDVGVQTGPLVGFARAGFAPFGFPLIPGTKIRGLTTEQENLFDAATVLFTANFIKAISGAQVSDKERQFLMGALPSEFNQEQVNRDNLKQLTDFLKNKYETQLGLDFSQLGSVIPQQQTVEETIEGLSPEQRQELIDLNLIRVN
ncbi:MAG: hypothetical protein IIB95_11465 [Candidatus Marinimicrobia bacterium]|nr:hypothetical protein [Candidatus Neomarinimicrobiota bacterium]